VSVFVITIVALLAATLALSIGLMVVALKLRNAASRLAELKKSLRDTRRASANFRTATEHANDGLVIQNMDATIVWANPAYCRIMGRDLDDMIGRNPLEFALPSRERPPKSAIRSFRYNPDDPEFRRLELVRNQRKDGTLFWNQISFAFHTNAAGDQICVVVCRDVSEQIEQEERLAEARDKLEHEATHDALTGLANRTALIRFADQALADAAKTGRQVGMLHVDLDRFKEINDTHGHAAGDEVLRHAARQLSGHVRRGDMVARVGGDEFVVVCPDLVALEDLRAVATKLSRALQVSIDWNDRVLVGRGSIGGALSGPGATATDDLLSFSDFALYEAKRGGRGRVEIYDDALARRHSNQTRRAADLTLAVNSNSLTHFFQPKMNLETGRISGFETLVRWQHPEDGMISPAEFLPLAEDLGLMGELDLCSMGGALEFKRFLARIGRTDMSVSFNASTELLTHPDFINRLVWGVESGGLRRDQVVIEVLETTVFGDPGEECSGAAVIRDLRRAGFQVMLDDFGIGHAGLSHLAQLDVTGVKIDQSLVRNMLTDAASSKIVGTIVELCNTLGLTVVAEGVETREVAMRLKRLGCDYIQGYWLSRPLPREDIAAWLDGDMRLTA